jgi:hypothetical protein
MCNKTGFRVRAEKEQSYVAETFLLAKRWTYWVPTFAKQTRNSLAEITPMNKPLTVLVVDDGWFGF